jgi:hypothetical protein
MSTSPLQVLLFDHDIPAHSQQATFLPALAHWQHLLLKCAERDYSTAANGIGFMMEMMTLTALGRFAYVGGMIKQEYVIAPGTRADFFVEGLRAFPHGVAIEVRDHLGNGSHGKKLTDTMQTYNRLNRSMRLVTIGSRSIQPTTLQNVVSISNSSQWVKHLTFDQFLEWTADIARSERKAGGGD